MPSPSLTGDPRVHAPEGTYGCDRSGLVWGYVFSRGAPATPVDADGATEWLSAADAVSDNEFVWLHVNLANAQCLPWLRQHLTLPDAFYESVDESRSAHHVTTRVELAGDWVVAVLNDVQFFSASEVSTVVVCANPVGVVSARTTPLRSVDRLRAAVRSGESFRSTGELVAHLLRDQADVLVEIVRKVTVEVDTIEDRLLTGHIISIRPKLGAFRRMLVRLQRLLAPEPASLFRLLNRPPAWISPQDVTDLRHSAEELAASVSDSVAVVERVRLLQEELVARVNEQTGRTLFVLTVVTVLALPLTIIPGLFGMNVGGVPFRDHDGGFWFVVLLLACLMACGGWLAFHRRGDS